MRSSRAAAVAAVTIAIAGIPATAQAGGGDGPGRQSHGADTVSGVATGLDGPRQLGDFAHHSFVVAESDTGTVAAVDRRTGVVTPLLTGLYSPQGVDYDDGLLFIALGGPPPPAEGGPAPAPGQASAALLVATPDGRIVHTVDLLAYEVAHNPDGQQQDAPDALSNPFAVLALHDRVLVADAGANDVLSVDRRTGDVSTFFVPPTVTDVAGCQNANPGTAGCDPVPTGVVQGPDGLIYVSTLGALTPGAARVYVLNRHGDVVRRIDGLSNATGLAVGGDGAVYVADLLHNAPAGEGPPPAGFDPSTVGQIVRIDRHDDRSYAPVTMPSGLNWENGRLYASAWSIAGQFGQAGAGQVVTVGPGAFAANPV